MRRRRLFIALLLLLAMVSAGVTPVSAAPAAPVGVVDAFTVSADGRSVVVSGWSVDPDVPGASVPVHIYRNGEGFQAEAGLARPDVNQALAVPGQHGFTGRIPLRPGTNTVCVFALSATGDRNSLLGCRDIGGSPDTGHDPIGVVDATMARPQTQAPDGLYIDKGQVVIDGWAFDPDAPTSPLEVHVYETTPDGRTIGAARITGIARPDVAAAYPGVGGRQGFRAVIALDRTPGTHQVCAFAVNVGQGESTLLRCSAVEVPPGLAFGNIDSITTWGTSTQRRLQIGHYEVTGWVLSPAAPQSRISRYITSFGADGAIRDNMSRTGSVSRPDVQAAFPGYADVAGFHPATTRSVTGGPTTVCLAATTIDEGDLDRTMVQCRQVTIPQPFGVIDRITNDGTTLTVEGWAIDPERPDEMLQITAYSDVWNGTPPSVYTDIPRPDVAAAFGLGEHHGFSWTTNIDELASGTTELCPYTNGMRVAGLECFSVSP